MENEKQLCRYCKWWVEEEYGTGRWRHGEAIKQGKGFCEELCFVPNEMFRDEFPTDECSCGKFEQETSWY